MPTPWPQPRTVHPAVHAAVLSALLLAAVPAAAHITLQAPTPRTEAQKFGPCGARDSVRGAAVTVFEPGATITVRWTETIDHPGHYRVSFDPDGQDSFYVPTGFRDVVTDGSDPTILLDDIADQRGGEYAVQVTLPDVECENCTLQLIQMMTDKPPYDVTGYFATGNDLYYQCADLALRRSAPADAGVGGSGGEAGAGGVGGEAGAGGAGGTPVDAGRGDAETTPPTSSDAEGGCALTSGGTGDSSAPIGLGLLALVALGRRRGRLTPPG